MFGKKKPVRLDLKMDSGYYRLIVDYFDAKDKERVREAMYSYLGESFGSSLLQVDSNFINKKMDGKEGDWMEALIQWGKDKSMAVDSFIFKREVSASVLGAVMGSKVSKPGYRVGMMLQPEHMAEAVKKHQEIGLGLHLGVGVLAEDPEGLLKDFCGGRIDEFNFEKYYTVDFYDYDLISRCVMKSLTAEPLEKTKKALEERLL